ncbi:protein-L-isoaspartate(D-aspartate) O-methyltransferase [Luteimonas yindakuii]|uniref:Protein-L-isoaspartate O-methyltransferase n=1 Tax=Luteimonas yindakuii TaxID=2565782 RepID=A0A4Z1RJ82_9GAMM|nr:protein-L-isoaspartate(D-aspartate) O-methyltransferase [Luteimonas yindakuii]TKS54169.1 protein-L-isoaspartate(D-aspartate) O-methyltransferase [Luteimonas yindakuii]
MRGTGQAARRLLAAILGGWGALAACAAPVGDMEDDMASQRARLLASLEAEGIRDARVLAAMRSVPRERFVPEEMAEHAYGDHPLPIGHGQTISQPYIVALMTGLLQPEPHHRVLEIGTGSGYQAAVLSGLVARVYTIEIVAPLADGARTVLAGLGYANVEVRTGDGYAGWPEAAPFDGIVVTAAPEQVPQALVDQLAPGGRMVVPVGPVHAVQSLTVIEKSDDGRVSRRQVAAVRFVPMTGGPDERPRPR